MANGVLIYGGTSYSFDKNYSWGYTKKTTHVKTVNKSTAGTIYPKNRYSYREYELPFENIDDTQLAALEAVEAYDGLVTFCPDGAGGVSITGFFSLGAPTKKYANCNTVTARFEESK
jgi:hypothetical protein